MTQITINRIRKRIFDIHPRTRKAQINTILGLIVKGGGMIISLLLVPMTIDYLTKETYGTWLTISSLVTMIAFFDIGIGNGLRNRLSEAISKQDLILAKSYVSTAYLIFGTLQAIFILIFSIAFRYVPWQRILNTDIDSDQIQSIILMTAVAISIKLVLDILSYVLFALQESSKVGLISFFSNVVILVCTYILTKTTHGNLLYLAAITVLSPIVVLLISGFIFYRKQLKNYKPNFRLANWKYTTSLLSLGYKFFIIQMAVIIVFYTDNIIITHMFGSSEVTTYNIAFRYYNIASTLFAIVTVPYWSAFTEASMKSDIEWMKRTYVYLQKIWVLFLILIIFMSIVANPLYRLWVGDRLSVPLSLSLVMGLSAIIVCWNNITITVINGIGNIKIQLLCSVFASLINIPLALYFGSVLELGSMGIILSTCISLLPATITGTIQAKKLINNQAQGIWAK